MENDNNSSNEGSPSISPQPQMSETERFNIIRSISEECIQEDELLELLAHKSQPICYDEFEPFGRMHIAQGLMKALSVKKLTSAGCKVKILIADRVAHLNNKISLKKAKETGQYFTEIWKAVGMNVDEGQVEFLWQTDEFDSRVEYWPLVLEIGRRNNLTKLLGSSEQDELSGGHSFHPCMQSAAILSLEADICQLGMDQRKVNELAREYCGVIKRKNKPFFLSHHMLPGLKEGQEKMSKSDPSSSIYMDDEEAEVNLKIKKAFCPPKVVLKNPCLEYIKYIIFPWFNEFAIERKADNGGNKTFESFKDLADDYESGELHPADLKPALAKALNRILQLVRDHFNNVPEAKELRKRVKVKQKKHPKSEFSNAFSKESDNNSSNEASPSQLLQPLLISPQPKMSETERFNIIRSIGEECIQEDELKGLLARKSQPICYDGFEPSGRMHIAQGVLKTINVNELISAGCKVKILVADWFAQMNNKMGGDLKKIRVIGEYLIEIWKALGMNVDEGQVEFVWSSDEINSRAHEYWPLVLDIAWGNTLPRLKRCCQIMGRSEQDELSGAQIFYPCMQCADVFFLKADICQLGMDQRKVNVLAREYCDDIKRKNKPIILSHHMLPGLKEGQEKMSKSDLSSSIYMEDEEVEVNLKIERAFCPPKIVEKNPCLEYIKHLIFPWFKEFAIERQADNGGNKTFKSFKDLADEYESGEVHPADLKPALAKAINRILQPVRDHFINDPRARELLKFVKSYNVTR